MQLDPAILNEVVEACAAAGLAGRRSILLGVLPLAYSRNLPTVDRPVDQLRSDLNEINQTPSIEGLIGSPLRTWLKNAIHILRSEGRAEAAALQAAVQTLIGTARKKSMPGTASDAIKRAVDEARSAGTLAAPTAKSGATTDKTSKGPQAHPRPIADVLAPYDLDALVEWHFEQLRSEKSSTRVKGSTLSTALYHRGIRWPHYGCSKFSELIRTCCPSVRYASGRGDRLESTRTGPRGVTPLDQAVRELDGIAAARGATTEAEVAKALRSRGINWNDYGMSQVRELIARSGHTVDAAPAAAPDEAAPRTATGASKRAEPTPAPRPDLTHLPHHRLIRWDWMTALGLDPDTAGHGLLAERALAEGQEVAASQFLLAQLMGGAVDERIDAGRRYVRLLAQAAGLHEAAELDDAGLKQASTPHVRAAMAIGIARLALVDIDLATLALGGKSPLFNAIRDTGLETLVPPLPTNAPRRARKQREWKWLEHLAEGARAFWESLIRKRDVLVASVHGTVRRNADHLLNHLGRNQAHLLPVEVEGWERLRDLLGARLKSVLDLRAQRDPSSADIHALDEFLQRADAFGAMRDVMGVCIFAPVARHLAHLVRTMREDVIEQSRPQIDLISFSRRRPLEDTARPIECPLVFQNNGHGAALALDVRIESDEDVSIEPANARLAGIRTGERRRLGVTLILRQPVKRLRLTVETRAQGVFGTEEVAAHDVPIESQGDTPDWAELHARGPYSLQPIEESVRLLGRRAQMEHLRVTVSSLSGTIVWGQKRVGKTSVARVLYNELCTRSDRIVLYIRKGDVAGADEATLGREIADRLAEQCVTRGLLDEPPPIPPTDAFGARLARLNRFVDGLRRRGVREPIVLIIDEFDELNPGFYRGERGDHFFSTLRSLSERRIALILVGSERMPAIFQRYAQQLNKLDTLRLDTIGEASDLRRLIEQPVEGFIEYETEAVNEIVRLSGGNPYYINLVCTRLFMKMVTSGRTFVDPTDVESIVDALARDNSTNHWSHLWEDDAEDDARRRRLRVRDAALVLAAFSRGPLNRPMSLADVREWLFAEGEGELPPDLNCEDTLERLVSRKVLRSRETAEGRRYRVMYPIFRRWLGENGRSELLVPFRSRTAESLHALPALPSRTIADAIDPTLPVDDDTLAAMIEGIRYRDAPLKLEHTKNWLLQFEDDAQIIVACKLLDAICRTGLVDESRMRSQIDHAFAVGLALFGKDSINEIALQSNRPIIANLYAGYLGASDSGSAAAARHLKSLRRLPSFGGGPTIAQWFARTGSTDRFVVLVERFADDEADLIARVQEFVDRYGDAPGVAQAISEARIVLVPLWAHAWGMPSLEALPLPVRPVTVLGDEARAFSDEAGIFATPAEVQIARDVCRHIGGQLWREHPLGLGGRQGLTVLPDAVPRSTLPLLWKRGIVNEREWRPLFA